MRIEYEHRKAYKTVPKIVKLGKLCEGKKKHTYLFQSKKFEEIGQLCNSIKWKDAF